MKLLILHPFSTPVSTCISQVALNLFPSGPNLTFVVQLVVTADVTIKPIMSGLMWRLEFKLSTCHRITSPGRRPLHEQQDSVQNSIREGKLCERLLKGSVMQALKHVHFTYEPLWPVPNHI
jgi:hypothetical protein